MKLFILPFLLYIARLWPFSTPHDCWRKSVCLPMCSAAPEVITLSLPLKQYFRTTSFFFNIGLVSREEMFWHDALFVGGCSRLKLAIAFSLLSSTVSSVSNFLLFYFLSISKQNLPQHPHSECEEWQGLHPFRCPNLSHWHCSGMLGEK